MGTGVSFLSLTRGGLLHHVFRRARLWRGSGRDVERQAIAAVALSWGPLMAAALVEHVAHAYAHGGPIAWDPLVLDFSVHTRLLLSIPLLIAAEHSLEIRTERCIARFIEGGFVPPEQMPQVAGLVADCERQRDRYSPELGAIALGIGIGQAVLWGSLPGGIMASQEAHFVFSAARVWYGLFALPLSIWLFGRSLWHWGLWSWLLVRLARLKVRPVPVHPDRRGGLEFLSAPAFSFALVGSAFAAAQSGVWATRMVHSGVHLKEFLTNGVGECVLVLALTFGPLLAFVPDLWRARYLAFEQYDELALRYSLLFQHRWIEVGGTDDLLGSGDIQSMADMGGTFTMVREMRVFPVVLERVVIVLGAFLAPMLPLTLLQMPLAQLLQTLASTALGLR
jgi:hypothetical protein